MKYFVLDVAANEKSSPSMRREWIEMVFTVPDTDPALSPSMRREWIEISSLSGTFTPRTSPSMRREWIEIEKSSKPDAHSLVSLHAEGVD